MSNVLLSEKPIQMTTVNVQGEGQEETVYIAGVEPVAVLGVLQTAFGGTQKEFVQAPKMKRKYTRRVKVSQPETAEAAQ